MHTVVLNGRGPGFTITAPSGGKVGLITAKSAKVIDLKPKTPTLVRFAA